MAKPRLSYSTTTSKYTTKRNISGAFNQLTQPQIAKLKDAFTLLDNDGDGFIQHDDLKQMLISLGHEENDAEQLAEDMLDSSKENCPTQPVTFSSFLNKISQHLLDVDTKEDLYMAFSVFGDNDFDMKDMSMNGQDLIIPMDELRESLIEAGMDNKDIDAAIKGFAKWGMRGGETFNASRFIEMIRDD